ncbi:MAG: decarboxylating 6-phosphogluconate dehydrogenase [Dehalococcoidia bacterium]
MQLGMVGLGRMGGSMATRLLKAGHGVTVFDLNPEAVEAVSAAGGTPASSLDDLVSLLDAPRTVWVMVPSGDITESTVGDLSRLLSSGDTLIDGGNSNYKDSQRRAAAIAKEGIDYLDAGTSGGVWGLDNGYCLMVGGPREAYDRALPILKALSPDEGGCMHTGPSGSGHYVKMVHNGIEYGLMQAYAEGFELLAAKKEFNLDLAEIAETWRHGSVVRSWLLDLSADAFREDPRLESLSSYVEDSGEGRWTVDTSVELAVPTPVITAALHARFRSRQPNPLGGRMLAALRNQFGGHAVRSADE